MSHDYEIITNIGGKLIKDQKEFLIVHDLMVYLENMMMEKDIFAFDMKLSYSLIFKKSCLFI